jgi:hypothetical protein
LDDKYSIRTIDQCLEELGAAQSKVFSCLDLTNGFWQLDLQPESRPYTAFTIPGLGQFQWTVMPQGLMGGPASFSRLMDVIMSDAQNVITYIDDVLIHSSSHANHMEFLIPALQRIKKAKLRLNPDKCCFGASSVPYLGHTITADGVRPGVDKSAALASAAPPTTVKQVKSFAGLANYFRGYIKNFSQLAAPLFELTRQDSLWKSTEKSGPLPPRALAAFTLIRDQIASRPLMKFPSREGTFHLYVDAALGDDKNEGGLGAVLMQSQPDGSKAPIGYASRRLAKHEKNYPAFLAELQSATYGMEFFHHYLVGRRFNLYTDHKPMLRLATAKLSTVHIKTLERLQLKMQQMYPDIRHVEGKHNTVADFLSRYEGLGCGMVDVSSKHEGLGCGMVDVSPSRLRKLQEADPQLKPWLQEALAAQAQGGQDTQIKPRFATRHMLIRDGLLHVTRPVRKGFTSDKPSAVLAPLPLRAELITEAHNSKIGGHGGAFRTAERIKEFFWWPNMDRDIEDHVSQCQTCLSSTNKGTLPPPPLLPLPALTRPNQRIHIDLFGPLKTSKTDKKFVLVITDAFSKLTHLRAIQDKSAPTVAQAILDHYLYVFGIPDFIITDQGKEFCNELQKCIWDDLCIEHKTTTPYHPQCNGQAEVFNRTMASYLTTALADAEACSLDWELYLGPLMFSYNTGVNKSTKVTPFYATFGFSPKLPLWQSADAPADVTVPKDLSFADHLSRLQHAQIVTRKIIVQNTNQVRQDWVDQQARTKVTHFPTYAPGDKVWVKICARNNPNSKISAKWERGRIVERMSAVTYKVNRVDRSGKKVKILNVALLKPDPQTPTRPVLVRPDSDADQDDTEDEADFDDAPHSSNETDGDVSEDDVPQPPQDQQDGFSSDDDVPPAPRYNLRSHDQRQLASALHATVSALKYLDGCIDLTPLHANGQIDLDYLMDLVHHGFTIEGVGSSPVARPAPRAGGGAAPAGQHRPRIPQPGTKPKTAKKGLPSALRRLQTYLPGPRDAGPRDAKSPEREGIPLNQNLTPLRPPRPGTRRARMEKQQLSYPDVYDQPPVSISHPHALPPLAPSTSGSAHIQHKPTPTPSIRQSSRLASANFPTMLSGLTSGILQATGWQSAEQQQQHDAN